MTDIFKSADWAREALKREEAMKRGPVFIFDPSKLTAEELEKLRAECLRPGGMIFLGEDPDSPQWSRADMDCLMDSTRYYGGPRGGGMK